MLDSFPAWGRMNYSNKEMEALCLDLAEKAEPLEASALREVAQNYKTAIEPEPKEYELRFGHSLLAVVVAYAILTPVYFFGPREAGDPPPTGRAVEQLGTFTKTADGEYTAQTYKFGPGVTYINGVRTWTYVDDPVPLVVYEGSKPLPATNYEFQALHPKNAWRFVTIKTSDGSDPNKNGKRYYIALPFIPTSHP